MDNLERNHENFPRVTGTASHSLDELQANSDPALETSVFTNAAVLRAGGKQAFLTVRTTDEGGTPAHFLFHQEDNLFTCCNRLAVVTPGIVQQVSLEILNRVPDALIIFQDIVWEDGGHLELPNRSISYQENWFRTAQPGQQYLKKRKRSSLRRRMNRWEEALQGQKIEFRFRKAKSDDLSDIVEMNIKTLESRGRRHHMPAGSRRNLEAIASSVGYFGGLYLNETLIAGDVLSIIGDEAWFHIGGYDETHRDFSPGNQLHARIAEACVNLGVTKFNFLWGNSRWKSDAGAQRIPVHTVFVSRTPGAWLSFEFINAYWPHLKQALRNRLAEMKRDLVNRA